MVIAPPAPTDDVDIIVDAKEVERLTSLDRGTIRKLVLAGDFPKHIQLTPMRKGWRRSLVLAWVASRERNPMAAYDLSKVRAGKRKGRR
jgi:predicted DNA-binding transcriptional regulator AlpA